MRRYGYDEIVSLNARGGCWLLLDGAVLDVTRWLPEHPGGSTIIPEQARWPGAAPLGCFMPMCVSTSIPGARGRPNGVALPECLLPSTPAGPQPRLLSPV